MSDVPPVLDPLPPPPTRGMARALFVATTKAFMAALVVLVMQINTLVAWLTTIGANITRSVRGTSATNLTIGLGDKAFTTQAGLGLMVGFRMLLASTASPVNQMRGPLKSYNDVTGEAVVAIDEISGAGTFAAWSISTIPNANKATAVMTAAGVSDEAYVTPKSLMDAAAFQALTDAPTIAWDVNLGFNAKVTQTAARIVGKPANMKDGGTYTLNLNCNGFGVTFHSDWDFGAAGTPTPVTTAGKIHKFIGQYNAATGKLEANYRLPA